MDRNKIIKLAGLNIGIAALNIILFSPGLFNINMSGTNALSTAIGGTAIFISAVMFFYGNYKLITEKEMAIKLRDVKTPEDYLTALKQASLKKTFGNDISSILIQIEGFQKKKEKIKDVLLQRFSVVDTGYERFNETVLDVEYVFYANIKSILTKINAFDEEDYERINSFGENRFSSKVTASKLSIYNEYISFIKTAIEDNEKILLKLDSLLLAISKLDSLEAGEIESMTEIQEVDELIRRTKNYE